MKGSFFKKDTFLYPGMRYGGLNPLTIHEIYAALTPSDSEVTGLPSKTCRGL